MTVATRKATYTQFNSAEKRDHKEMCDKDITVDSINNYAKNKSKTNAVGSVLLDRPTKMKSFK